MKKMKKKGGIEEVVAVVVVVEVEEEVGGVGNSCFFFCHSMKFPSLIETKTQMEEDMVGRQREKGKVDEGFDCSFFMKFSLQIFVFLGF